MPKTSRPKGSPFDLPKGFGQSDFFDADRVRGLEPISHYYPCRYEILRPWVELLGMAGLGAMLRDGDTTSSDNIYEKTIKEGLKDAGKKLNKRDVKASYAQMAGIGLGKSRLNVFDDPAFQGTVMTHALEYEHTAFYHWSRFLWHGQHVFDFSQPLLNLLAVSDIDKTLFEDLHLPHPCIYLHFGRQKDYPIVGGILGSFETRMLRSLLYVMKNDKNCPSKLYEGIKPPEYVLEGAYVYRTEPDEPIQIQLIGSKLNSPVKTTLGVNFLSVDDDLLHETLSQEHESLGLSAKAALGERREEYLRRFEEHQKNLPNPVSGDIDWDDMDQVHLNEVAEEDQLKELGFLNALKLIANCLFYINAYPDEIEEDDPKPERKAVSVRKVAPQSAGKHLTMPEQEKNRSYRRVYFCGRKEVEMVADLSERNQAEGRSRTFMGRRGTWRWQACGIRFSERKRIWIRPIPDPTGKKLYTIYHPVK